MTDRTHHVPIYRCKKSGGHKYGCVSLADGTGHRRDILLGKYGTPESKAEYAKVIAQWEAADRRCVPGETDHKTPDISIAELLVAFWEHAQEYYRRADGTPTGEIAELRFALRPLREKYASLAAASFGPRALETIRQEMMVKPITTRFKVTDPKSGKRVWTQGAVWTAKARVLQRLREVAKDYPALEILP